MGLVFVIMVFVVLLASGMSVIPFYALARRIWPTNRNPVNFAVALIAGIAMTLFMTMLTMECRTTWIIGIYCVAMTMITFIVGIKLWLD